MKKIIVLFGIIACSYSSEWNFGNYGGGGLTLGEISLDHHDSGAFSLGETGIPMVKKVPVSIPYPLVQTYPQPYPVTVLIPRPVPYQVEKQVIKTVEKKVPTPVEKIIPIKIEKAVPYHVVKYVPVPIAKPFPIKIPVYKTIVHKAKGH